MTNEATPGGLASTEGLCFTHPKREDSGEQR